MQLDTTTDFETVVDNLEAVTLEVAGQAALPVANALGRMIAHDEADPSDGKALSADQRWHLPTTLVATQPPLGSVIVRGSERWTILSVTHNTFRTRWVCTTRELSIAAGLDQLITIEKATYAKAAGGASEPTWQAWQAGIKARVQPTGADNDVSHERHSTATRARIIVDRAIAFEQGTIPGRDYRIKDRDGGIWKIIGYERSERLELLPVIVAEQSPWPMG